MGTYDSTVPILHLEYEDTVNPYSHRLQKKNYGIGASHWHQSIHGESETANQTIQTSQNPFLYQI
ncbi:hypothetical protein BABINDRAFT_160180 [Babjeviella inositovora NRRL Y-12698]|uniref:Uncharacterized protein n=1 Tax=Babjeviella inositovora NRRL Y-12698 TaxID=984486 RepID=A0A1E3QXZ3_9ASCO|nr:uncharacterized protein BABINDRAFT_160180 [Babjeviella inositovora NRRL Y-12698]ODQ81962.1 hypothetical protein BABINDRAFT_160180 [Babjeviella inositovora NRRL Y-12698]